MRKTVKICSFVLIISLFAFCFVGCKTEREQYDKLEFVDVHLKGMNVYYNYYVSIPYHPMDSVAQNLLPDDSFLENYKYSTVDFHYFMKDFEVLHVGGLFAQYTLNIMILTYDDLTYYEAKNYLFNQNNATHLQNGNSFVYKGYNFVEKDYGDGEPYTTEKLLFHIHNDDKKTIILLNWKNSNELQQDDFDAFDNKIDFFKFYYGNFYSFDEKASNEQSEAL